MRVKLSYTAEIDEVLPEAGYMLKNLGETINETIQNYNELLNLLADEESFNSKPFFTKLDQIRQALGRLDYRFVEVSQIVSGYESYGAEQRQKALEEDTPPDSIFEASEAEGKDSPPVMPSTPAAVKPPPEKTVAKKRGR
jgi:hypothetical protein